MTHEEADSGHVNPHAREKGGTENCQMCAVVYEGRLRGYNFIAKVYNDSNKYMRRLSYDMSLAFIDPITKKNILNLHICQRQFTEPKTRRCF